MKKFFVLVKKEIKELLTIQMILPLVIMVVIFAMIGGIVSKETKKNGEPQLVYLLNHDTQAVGERIANILISSGFRVKEVEGDPAGLFVQASTDGASAIIGIPDGFSSGLDSYMPEKLELFSILDDFSLMAASRAQSVRAGLSAINESYYKDWIALTGAPLSAEDLKNPVGVDENVVIAGKSANVSLAQTSAFIQQQTTFIPIILFFVIVIAAQMVAMTVANEKENKTFETLLSLPVNRKTIVFAKLLAAGIVAVLFAGFYMVGFNYYLKGLTGNITSGAVESAASAMQSLGVAFSASSFVLLGVSLFLGILVALSIAIILGALAESVKSVQAVTTPLMVLVLLPYLLVMFLDINKVAPFLKYLIYAIPFSHPFLAAQKIMLHDCPFVIYGILYQLAIFLVFVFVAAKIFSTDRILTIKLGGKRKRAK